MSRLLQLRHFCRRNLLGTQTWSFDCSAHHLHETELCKADCSRLKTTQTLPDSNPTTLPQGREFMWLRPNEVVTRAGSASGGRGLDYLWLRSRLVRAPLCITFA